MASTATMLLASSRTLFLVAAIYVIALTSFCCADKLPDVSFKANGHLSIPRRSNGSAMLAGPKWPGVLSSPSDLLPGLVPRQNDDGDPEPSRYGPRAKGCLWCPEQSALDLTGYPLLKFLTTAKMRTYMRGGEQELNNKCVFYSKPTRPNSPAKLSGGASQWACDNNKYSIWHLWPNALIARGHPEWKDFYGIFDADNWLNSIIWLRGSHPPRYIIYFENMSEAMAEACRGEVIVMTQDPHNLARFMQGDPNIWRNKELPALRRSKIANRIDRTVVVDYDTHEMWEFDILDDNFPVGQPVTSLRSRSVQDVINGTGMVLDKRAGALCESSGVDKEPAGLDIFNDPYNVFPVFEKDDVAK